MALRTNPTQVTVQSATNLPESPKADHDRRVRNYLISMGIRTLCFLLAVLVFTGWIRWTLIAAAVVLPYIAVVLANAVDRRRIEAMGTVAPTPVYEALEPGKNL